MQAIYRARRALAIAALLLLALGAAIYVSDRLAERRAVAAERQRLGNVAALAAAGLQRQIDKFQLVATTLSADPDVHSMLANPTAERAIRLNTRLSELTTALDASVIYLMDLRGTTIASGNWQKADSFVGQNYAFRRYFTEAIKRGRWEQYALGTRSNVPGQFLAQRIDDADQPLGVLVVKIRFDQLEREWANAAGPSFVTNKDGIILVTSNPGWRFQTLKAFQTADRERLRSQLEFGDASLLQQSDYARGQVLRNGAYDGQSFLEAKVEQPNGWTVHVLTSLDAAVAAARNSARLLLLLLSAILLGGWIVLALRRRARVQREQREHQERIDELKDRLAQANKLSTLGQIAAGVGHELNQPLTAIAMRADNARKLIKAQRATDADAALMEIATLVERAGAITGELRTFARRGDRGISEASLSTALQGLQLLLGDRIHSLPVALEIALDEPDFRVVAEPGKLEQVLVNLVQNSLDAVGERGRIAITARRSEGHVLISVTDNGPGISEAIRAALFQPFSTNKPDGLGLGLVISRDIVAEFGGELVHLETERGTCFQLRLKAAA